MKFKPLLCLALLVVISYAVVADDEIELSNKFDPKNPEKFDYVQGDYSSIKDWSKVEWGMVDYKNPTFNLQKIPAQYAAEIDVNEAIWAGKGQQLTVKQIEANVGPGQEGIEDLQKIGQVALKKYFRKKFKATIDLQQCRAGACSLKDGMLSNRGMGKLPLKDIKGIGAQVQMFEGGSIVVTIKKKATLKPSKDSDYAVVLNGGKASTLHFGSGSGVKRKVLQGQFYFRGGKVFVLPGVTTFAGVGDVKIKGKNRVELLPNPLRFGDVYENKLYVSKDQIELSGSGFLFDYKGKGIKSHKKRKIRNGHVVTFIPTANKKLGVESRVAFYAKTGETEVQGDAQILNDNHYIRAEDGHFISELRSKDSLLQSGEEAYDLYDMNLFFAGESDNRVSFHKNNVNLGDKTKYYSVQFNELGDVDLQEHIGPRVKDKVIKPNIVLIGARTGVVGMSLGEEEELWETNRQSWLANRRPDRPVIMFDLDKFRYSAREQGVGENHKFVGQLLGFAQENKIPLSFAGHSGETHSKDEFILVVNDHADPKEANLHIPVNLLYSGEGKRFPTRPSINNPVIAGCASGPLIGKGDLNSMQAATLNMYLVARSNADKPHAYNWKRFVQDIQGHKIEFPDQQTCEAMTSGIRSFYTGKHSREEITAARRACLT